jgi:hypothetical protein
VWGVGDSPSRKHYKVIRSLELIDSIYTPTPGDKVKAKAAILAHDAAATDILEILGLNDE